ncbi:regulatory protein GemA [Desulfonatronovibrio hydrogenovorans]|uniref:regulatory protein GemA n=1 Tax=Desulfonatronovibrio hydrogenovorans TaxID=53245 RepID=UPI0013771A20|nr:regulatory protein GemA [Desulfonatronovibrio hydrogenovorans]
MHIAKKDLGLPEDIYRGILSDLFGSSSAGKLKNHELVQLCTHFEKIGWEPRPRKSQVKPAPEKAQLIKKVWALCYCLERPVPAYAHALAKRMYKTDRVEWLYPDQLQGIVAALERQKSREGMNA